MALPQDGQNANGLTKVTQIPAGKELMFIDPTTNEGGIITLEDLTKQILNGLTSQTFGLDSGTQTLPAAINYLYGNCKMFTILKDNAIVLRDPKEAKKYFESLTADSFPHFWLVYSVRGSEGTFFISKSTFVLGTILCWSFDAPQIRMLRCRNTEWLDSDWRTI